ncbi:hypothetical protein LCGC14_0365650 [marine sediment metagenome]|uniref:Uncharacterized protein n=1 Tax=marine sediment metagenome TaxID=412755 RepID=A0A0F9TCM4_9ZZZZ
MDTMTLVDNRIKAMSDINDRMDETSKFLHWDDTPYKLVKPDGKTLLTDAISVTPNMPKVFVHSVVADLMSGKWQTVVEGSISGRQSHIIETFADDNLIQADEYMLKRYGIPSLFGWLCNHVCVRWAIGVRWISQVIDGEYKIDCLPVDMRWTPFERGEEGLWWVCPQIFMSGSAIKRKYPDVNISEGDDKKYEVRDFWDGEKNELWIEGKKVEGRQEKNPFGHPPFVIVIPASGFMLRDEGYLKHEGEDILFLNAGLYTELARSLSLEQTSGYAGLYPAYEQERINFDGRPSEPVPELDESVAVREGERHLPVPRGDINKAGQTARVDLQTMIENGGPITPRQYNTPPSAILLAGETEMISRLQNSRKQALGIFRSQLVDMMIAQFIKVGKGEVLIGKQGKKTKYSPSKLGNPDEYTVNYQLTVKSRRQEIANLAEFTAAYGKLPLKWNLTNILMVDDPDGIIGELDIEKWKDADPSIGMFEGAMKYAGAAEDMEDGAEKDFKNWESMMLVDEGVRIVKQRMQPQQLPEEAATPQVEKPKSNANALLGLGSGGGGQTRPPQEVV